MAIKGVKNPYTQTTFEECAKHIKFPTGSRMLFYGGSESGKTTLISKMLKASLWFNRIDNVLYVNPSNTSNTIYQCDTSISSINQLYPKMLHTNEIPNFAKDERFNSWLAAQYKMYRGSDTHLMIFIDDYQTHMSTKSTRKLEEIFTTTSHHANLTVIVTLQAGACSGTRANAVLNAIKPNLTHCVVLSCDAYYGMYATIERHHNPFRNWGHQKLQGYKCGGRLAACMKIVEQYYTYPYLILDFNQYSRHFVRKYPVRSLVCQELGQHVIALLFEQDFTDELLNSQI